MKTLFSTALLAAVSLASVGCYSEAQSASNSSGGSRAARTQKGEPMNAVKKYLTLNEENFQREIIESREPVLVEFWANWCQPCHAIAPVIEELADDFEGSAKVGKVDVDENPSLAAEFSVHSIPSLLFFKDGNVVHRVSGVVAKQVLAEKLKALVDLVTNS